MPADRRVRVRPENEVPFTIGRSYDYTSSVNVWTGRGRGRKERRISLTTSLGNNETLTMISLMVP